MKNTFLACMILCNFFVATGQVLGSDKGCFNLRMICGGNSTQDYTVLDAALSKTLKEIMQEKPWVFRELLLGLLYDDFAMTDATRAILATYNLLNIDHTEMQRITDLLSPSWEQVGEEVTVFAYKQAIEELRARHPEAISILEQAFEYMLGNSIKSLSQLSSLSLPELHNLRLTRSASKITVTEIQEILQHNQKALPLTAETNYNRLVMVFHDKYATLESAVEGAADPTSAPADHMITAHFMHKCNLSASDLRVTPDEARKCLAVMRDECKPIYPHAPFAFKIKMLPEAGKQTDIGYFGRESTNS